MFDFLQVSTFYLGGGGGIIELNFNKRGSHKLSEIPHGGQGNGKGKDHRNKSCKIIPFLFTETKIQF